MRKVLLVLELENTLLQTYSLGTTQKVFGSERIREPDFSKDGIGIYYRRGREDLLESLFTKV